MATLPALLNQLETLAQAETVNESQASKIITELKVVVCFDPCLKLKKIWSNSIDVTQESLNKNSELLGALSKGMIPNGC